MTALSSTSREPDSPPADVFISYSSADRDRVRSLVEQLERAGWRVWWDRKLLAGSSFQQEIEKALELAGCVIVAWSKNSVASDWVIAEAEEGRKRQVLIPVALDGATPPLQFRTRHTVDLSGWRGGTSPEVVEILRALEALLGPHLAPPKSVEKARSPVAVAKKVPATPSKAAKPGPSGPDGLLDNIKVLIIAGATVLLLGIIGTVVAVVTDSNKGSLMVTVEPATAKVRVDGQLIEPNTVIELKPGAHQLVATSAGFLPHEQQVNVRESKNPLVVPLKLEADHPTNVAGVPGMREMNVSRPGQDYSTFSPTSEDPFECERACANEAKCKAYTYVPREEGTSAQCLLKSAVPAPIGALGKVSGVKRGLELDTDRIGNDRESRELDQPEPEQCQALCSQNDWCKAFTYVAPGVSGPKARCWLKDGIPPATSSGVHAISGTKGTEFL